MNFSFMPSLSSMSILNVVNSPMTCNFSGEILTLVGEEERTDFFSVCNFSSSSCVSLVDRFGMSTITTSRICEWTSGDGLLSVIACMSSLFDMSNSCCFESKGIWRPWSSWMGPHFRWQGWILWGLDTRDINVRGTLFGEAKRGLPHWRIYAS